VCVWSACVRSARAFRYRRPRACRACTERTEAHRHSRRPQTQTYAYARRRAHRAWQRKNERCTCRAALSLSLSLTCRAGLSLSHTHLQRLPASRRRQEHARMHRNKLTRQKSSRVHFVKQLEKTLPPPLQAHLVPLPPLFRHSTFGLALQDSGSWRGSSWDRVDLDKMPCRYFGKLLRGQCASRNENVERHHTRAVWPYYTQTQTQTQAQQQPQAQAQAQPQTTPESLHFQSIFCGLVQRLISRLKIIINMQIVALDCAMKRYAMKRYAA
jgi:hypothetical protein